MNSQDRSLELEGNSRGHLFLISLFENLASISYCSIVDCKSNNFLVVNGIWRLKSGTKGACCCWAYCFYAFSIKFKTIQTHKTKNRIPENNFLQVFLGGEYWEKLNTSYWGWTKKWLLCQVSWNDFLCGSFTTQNTIRLVCFICFWFLLVFWNIIFTV